MIIKIIFLGTLVIIIVQIFVLVCLRYTSTLLADALIV